MEHLPYIVCPLNAWASPRFNACLLLTNLPGTPERMPKSDSCCDLKDCVCQVPLWFSLSEKNLIVQQSGPHLHLLFLTSDFSWHDHHFPCLPDWKGGNYPRLICASHSLTPWLPQVVSCNPFYLEWNPEGIKVGKMNRGISVICRTTSDGFKCV